MSAGSKAISSNALAACENASGNSAQSREEAWGNAVGGASTRYVMSR